MSNLVEGAKFDSDKVPLHLLSGGALIRIAEVLDFGAKKYEPWNWAKGILYSRVYSAMLRHLIAWWEGETFDPETGLNHLAHAGCCLMFLLHYISDENGRYNVFDDRPTYIIHDPVGGK